jgi:DNA invertase Pin-like site-specific DNA recombinase
MKTAQDKLLSAKQLLEANDDDQEPLGYGPDYFDHLRDIVPRAAKNGVVLYARISDPRPGTRETCTDQLAYARKRIAKLEKEFGVRLDTLGEFPESVKGWQFTKSDRPELVKAAKLAKSKDAVLVGFDVSRFVRNEDCQNGALPTVDDFEQFMRLVGKVKLATITNPKIHEDRSRSTKRGQKASNKKPGRPKKKSYRPSFDKMPNKVARVVRLRDSGMTWPKIAKAVGRAESTIRGWYSHE